MGETLFSDAFVYSVDHYIGKTDFSQVTFDAIHDHLTGPWVWDQSLFATNQLMHPLHGYSYFSAGRSNGLGFYESAALAAYGSANWELFCERCAPAMNDLLETTMGGAVFGEMFHRLYLEAKGSGGKLAFLASPVDGINALVTGNLPEGTRGNIQTLTVSSGAGDASARRYQAGREVGEDNRRTPALDYRFACVYGDPFSQDTAKPFDQFELGILLGGGYEWYAASIFSDGYLFAFPLADRADRMASAGLTLHYDVLWTEDIQFAANALDFTIKSRRAFPGGFVLEDKCHAGAILLGVSNFYVPDSEGTTAQRDELHDYGVGGNAAVALSLADKRTGGVLSLDSRIYWMKVLPGTVENSEGSVLCQRYALEYRFPVGRKVSLRLGDACTLERGWYSRVPDVRKIQNEASVGFILDLGNRG